MEITKDPKDFFEIVAHFNTMVMDFVEDTIDVNCVNLANDRWLFNLKKTLIKKRQSKPQCNRLRLVTKSYDD